MATNYTIRNSYQPQLPFPAPRSRNEMYENIVILLELILEDGTGSIDGRVRAWPIRASYHRAGTKLLRALKIEKFIRLVNLREKE